MESYLIIIYRNGDEMFPDRLVGTFADPCADGEQRFTTLAELHRLVDAVGGRRGNGGSVPGPGGRRSSKKRTGVKQ
ncbi:MAG: hypothetical protein KKB30_06165 [Proteobacteria bacterium]|nr:hypothetical protein [Pseudomonadota bacterium]MBU1715105.1 hypothetical protein [Pseudomonadota bacterium]